MSIPPRYNDLVAALHTTYVSALPTLITSSEEPIRVDAFPFLYSQFVSSTTIANAPVHVVTYLIQSTLVGYKVGGRSSLESTLMDWADTLEYSINGTTSGRRAGLSLAAYPSGLITMESRIGKWSMIGGDEHRIIDCMLRCIVKRTGDRP